MRTVQGTGAPPRGRGRHQAGPTARQQMQTPAGRAPNRRAWPCKLLPRRTWMQLMAPKRQASSEQEQGSTHQEVGPKRSCRVVVHAAGAEGHITHDEGLLHTGKAAPRGGLWRAC